MVYKEATFHGKQPEVEVEFVNQAALEIAAAEALAVAGNIDASDVQVTAEDDDIVLSGTVGTVEESSAQVQSYVPSRASTRFETRYCSTSSQR